MLHLCRLCLALVSNIRFESPHGDVRFSQIIKLGTRVYISNVRAAHHTIKMRSRTFFSKGRIIALFAISSHQPQTSKIAFYSNIILCKKVTLCLNLVGLIKLIYQIICKGFNHATKTLIELENTENNDFKRAFLSQKIILLRK